MYYRNKKLFLGSILLFFNILLNAQSFKIIHEGELSGNWQYNSKNTQYNYSVTFTTPEGVKGSNSNLHNLEELDKQDRDAQLYINFMNSGGIYLKATNYQFDDFIDNYINNFEYNEYLETYKQTYISKQDYYKKKYGDNLPPISMRKQIGNYSTYFFVTEKTEETDNKEHKNYTFYIPLEGGNGIQIHAEIIAKKESSYSLAEYENLMFQHIQELKFIKSDFQNDNNQGDKNSNINPPVENDDTWTIVIGVISGIVIGLIIRKLMKKKQSIKNNSKPNDENEEDAHYILQLNKEIFSLNLKEPDILEVKVWKVTTKGQNLITAQISINNPEPKLKIQSSYLNQTFQAQLLVDETVNNPNFFVTINATAEGKSIQKNIQIIVNGKKQILVETQPNNKRTLRPGTDQVITCFAEVVDETGKSLLDLTKKILVKPMSDWLDLSDPVLLDKKLAINVAASSPNQLSPSLNMPPSVFLKFIMEDVEKDEQPLETDLEIRLLNCTIETDIQECYFSFNDQNREIQIHTYIENAPQNESWNFEAQYQYGGEADEPATDLQIHKESESSAIISLIGPTIKLQDNENQIVKTLVISAYQEKEKPIERHIKVIIAQEGLFIVHGTDHENVIRFTADKPFQKLLELAVYQYDKSTKNIKSVKVSPNNIQFNLLNEEQDIQNFESVLKLNYEFKDYFGEVPYIRYWLKTEEKMPGFGDEFTLNYQISVHDINSENPELFQKELIVKVKTYGIGPEFKDWQDAYENCKKILFHHVPEGETQKKLFDILEKYKLTLGAEGINEIRKRVWKIAYNLILAEGEKGYKAEEQWADHITTTLEWTEWVGDLAFNALVAFYMKSSLAAVPLSMSKAYIIEALNFYIYEQGTIEDFIDIQINKIIPLLLSVTKGRLITVENIEIFVLKNKALAYAVFIGCEFAFNLYQTKSFYEAAKITALQLLEEVIIRFLTVQLHKNQLKYKIKFQSVDDALDDVMKRVKTDANGKKYLELTDVLDIMKDPAQIRSLKKHAPEWLQKVFDDSRNQIYEKHDKELLDYLSKTYKIPHQDIKIDDFRTPGTKGFNLNTDRDYRVLKKVKTSDGKEIWIELQKSNWLDKSYEIFGKHTQKPYGISDKEWAERHLQRGTDRFDAEASKDYSDHIYNADTGEIIIGEPNISKVKHGKGTLYDAEGIGKMYQNKIMNSLEPGMEVEAFAQAKKGVESLEKIHKSYINQGIKLEDIPENLQEAMKIIKDVPVDANHNENMLQNINNKLNQLGYKGLKEVAQDLANEFKKLKPYDNPAQTFKIVNK